MAARPIEARCNRCGEVFALLELRETGTGKCPRCGRAIAPDWTPKLLHDAVRAEVAHERLVSTLRGFRQMPAAMQVLPSSVLESLFTETGWSEQLAEDPQLAQSEMRKLRRLLASWKTAADVGTRQPRRRTIVGFGRKPKRAALVA